MDRLKYNTEAMVQIERRISQLRTLSVSEAKALPEVSGEEEITLADIPATITIFRQQNPHNLPDAVLVTVQVARTRLLGFGSSHIEKGLVFCTDKKVRDATNSELQNSLGG